MQQTFLQKSFYFLIGFLGSFFLMGISLKITPFLVLIELIGSTWAIQHYKKLAPEGKTPWRNSLNGLLWGNGAILLLIILLFTLLSTLLGSILQ